MSIEFLVTTAKDLLTSWPFVVLILGLVYHRNVRDLLDSFKERNLKIKAPGVEIESSGGKVRGLPTPQDEDSHQKPSGPSSSE